MDDQLVLETTAWNIACKYHYTQTFPQKWPSRMRSLLSVHTQGQSEARSSGIMMSVWCHKEDSNLELSHYLCCHWRRHLESVNDLTKFSETWSCFPKLTTFVVLGERCCHFCYVCEYFQKKGNTRKGFTNITPELFTVANKRQRTDELYKSQQKKAPSNKRLNKDTHQNLSRHWGAFSNGLFTSKTSFLNSFHAINVLSAFSFSNRFQLFQHER